MRSKKVLILSSTGGYGHIAASNTLIDLLGEEWEVTVTYPINDLRFWGAPNGEAFYNFLLSNNLIRLANACVRFVTPSLFRDSSIPRAQALVQKVLEQEKPDLLISVIPFINFPASEAARVTGTPFLLVTTDNDLKNWVLKVDRMKHSNFKVTVGGNMPKSRKALEDKKIPPERIETIGLPLRPHFSKEYDIEQMREQHGIGGGRKVVLVMLGGMGNRATYKYARAIAKLQLGVHLILCTGKNRALARRLKGLKVAEGNTLDIVPFTECVHELMALSDVLITKPGPGTINEAIALRLPILIDQIDTTLFWEQINIDMVHQYRIGECIRSLSEIEETLKRYLYDENLRVELNAAFDKVPRNRFASEIQGLIDDLCSFPVEEMQQREVGVLHKKSSSFPPIQV